MKALPWLKDESAKIAFAVSYETEAGRNETSVLVDWIFFREAFLQRSNEKNFIRPSIAKKTKLVSKTFSDY